MDNKSVIVIGAGIAGLAAGCYAQMNGYQSAVYEMHDIPGGLCTSWQRCAYKFDGCIDWLTGSAPDRMFYPMWEELGAIKNNRFLYMDEYCRYRTGNGEEIVFYLDTKKLEAELKAHAPEDSQVIEDICQNIRALFGFAPKVNKALEVMDFWDTMGMMADLLKNRKAYQAFFKYGKLSLAELSKRFKNEALKGMFGAIWGDKIPASLFFTTMAWCAQKTAGYPEGGSLKFARDIEKRYLELGGKIHYKKTVDKILVQNNKAVGVRLSDDSKILSDIVISAADGHNTLYHMLEGKYMPDKTSKWYKESETFPPYLQISFGVNRDMQKEPRLIYQILKEPLTIAGKNMPYMIIHNYSFDKTLSPEGKTPLIVRFFTDFDYWTALYSDRENYRQEKEKISKAVAGALERLYPGISNDIETTDVATPATYMRYTGNFKGATMSWLPTTGNFGKTVQKTLPGLNSFYMAGQWLCPGGGLPNAAKTGRDVIQILCKKDKKLFQTTKA